jgi:hypothetical protein
MDRVDNLPAVGRDYHPVHISGGAGALRDPANHRFSGDFD